MEYEKLMEEAGAIVRERHEQYGEMNEVVVNICKIFGLVTGVSLTPYHAHMFLLCVKLARMKNSPEKLDNYVDGINYLAFAAEYGAGLDDGAREIAAKYAPIRTEGFEL
jgi:hypothetical protein